MRGFLLFLGITHERHTKHTGIGYFYDSCAA